MTLTSDADAGALLQPVLARLRILGSDTVRFPTNPYELIDSVKGIAPKTVLPDRIAHLRHARFLLEGWACRFEELPDGRRQVFDLILPGDSLDFFSNSSLFGDVSVLALTKLQLAYIDPALLPSGAGDGLTIFEAHARAERKRVLRQLLRLGQMTALERLADLFFEFHERLEEVKMVSGAHFAFPLTQETLSDLTGLSVVHVNRTLQELRRKGLLILERGKAGIPDVEALAVVACRTHS